MKVIDQYHGNNFVFYNGDSCEIMTSLPDESVHYLPQEEFRVPAWR